MLRTNRWPLRARADDNAGGSSAAAPDLGDDVADLPDDPDELEDDDASADEGADDAGAAGADAADDDAGKPVPGKRVAELVAKAEKRATEALRAELDALRGQVSNLASPGPRMAPAAQIRAMEAKVDELENAYEESVFAGKPAEAKVARQQIRQIEAALADYKVELRTQAARTGAAEDVRYAVVLESIEMRYPELDPDNEAFDRAKETEVTNLVDALIATGIAKDIALKRAVKYALGERRGKAGELNPEDDPKLQRTIEARTRAARAAARTPANTEGIGRAPVPNDDKKIDLSRRITPDAFKKFNSMSDNERAKLRGDTA